MSTPRNPLVSEFANDPDMVELVELFVSEIPDRVESLRTCWNDRDIERLARLAHQLKGASAGYGFSPIGVAAGDLEQALRSGIEENIQEVTKRLDELVALCNRAVQR